MQHTTSVSSTKTLFVVRITYFKECPCVFVVYFVIRFKNGTGIELGDCKCGAQTPESGDIVDCMYAVVDTEYHHHVLSGCGLWLYLWLCLRLWLWLWFKMLGFWFIS